MFVRAALIKGVHMKLRLVTASLCLGILMSLTGCQPAGTDTAPAGTTVEAAPAALTTAETAAVSGSTASAAEETDLSGDAHKQQQTAEDEGGDSEVVDDYKVEIGEDEVAEFE
jgi:hypothetical protein